MIKIPPVRLSLMYVLTRLVRVIKKKKEKKKKKKKKKKTHIPAVKRILLCRLIPCRG